MKPKPRLTRQQSQEATRQRLIRAAERLFIKSGFDATSVEDIVEEAGFSRGAFYSNFRSKDELFIAALNQKRREFSTALDDIFSQKSEPARRLARAREWYVTQEPKRDWQILETEFALRALRNRTARTRLADLHRQEMENYSALVALHFSEAGVTAPVPPEVIALSLYAIAKGLAGIALLDSGGEAQGIAAECRSMVFNRLFGVISQAKASKG